MAKKKTTKQVKRPAARSAKRRAPLKKKVPYKPAGHGDVTPNVVVQGCAEAIELWKKVFGAKERSRMTSPDGKQIWHAELRIGDSTVFANDAMDQDVGTGNMSLMVYVRDCDAVFERALQAGAEIKAPLMDMFWGDRYGMVKDPYGIHWAIATHKEDVRPAALKKRAEEFARSMAERQAAE